jgi:surfeit locus 1 family protein
VTPLQLLAILISLGAATLFGRLGVWQLERLGERRAFNALVASRVDSLPVPLAGLPADTGLARFRRVRVEGTYDFEHQIVVTGRSRNGSPGVHLLTPLLLQGSDTAVLVHRGWVYSPDATRVELARWDEAESASFEGFVLPFPTAPREGSPIVPGQPRTLRWLEPTATRDLVPHPLAPFTIVSSAEVGDAATSPARLTVPPLDEGSHASYAFQWFSFAAIAIVGGVLLVRHERRRVAMRGTQTMRGAA